MTEIIVRDIMIRGGGRTLLRYGVPFVSSGGIGRTGEAKEAFTRAAPTLVLLDRDGFVRDAATDVMRLHYPPGIVDAAGNPLPGILIETGRQNKIENGDVETDSVGVAAQNGSTIARNQTNARHGSWAIQATTANLANSGLRWQTRAGTNIVVVASRLYSMTVDVFAPTASVGKTLQLRMRWKDVSNVEITNSISSVVALVAGWQRMKFTASSPALTTQVELTCETNTIEGIFDFWGDLACFNEGAYPTEPVPTNTGTATSADDICDVPVNIPMDRDWSAYLHLLPAHGNVTSWPDTEPQLDPCIFGLFPTAAGSVDNDSLRLHRQNALAQYEWEYGPNTPTATRTFTPGTAPQKIVCRHYASDHHLDCAIDGSAFAVSAAPVTTPFRTQVLLRFRSTGFSAPSPNITLFDFIMARGLHTQTEFEALP